MAIDNRDDARVPSPERPDPHPAHPRFEPRDREQYYAARLASAPPNSEPTWEDKAELSRWMWSEYKRRWPPEERPPPDRSADPPGSWRSDTNRYLNPTDNHQVEAACDRIAKREQKTISPALQALDSRDSQRHLIGFEHRLKGRDRVKEKIYDDMDLLGRSPREAIASLPDAIRYTFQYDEVRYTQSVRNDIASMKEKGFELDVLKNSWSSEQYKGINTQWVEPGTGQRFELQFHTRISFEAKQITHTSYERLRSGCADPFEELVLEAFQKNVSAAVPIPPGATDIPDYREGDQHAR